MSLRRRSVLLRVALLVLVPLVFLVGLFSYTVTTSVTGALTLIRSKVMMDDLGQPVASLQQALTRERAQTIVYYARPTPAALAALQRQQLVTDQAVALRHSRDGLRICPAERLGGRDEGHRGPQQGLAGLAGAPGQDTAIRSAAQQAIRCLQRHDRCQLPGTRAGDLPRGQLDRRYFPASRSLNWRYPTSTSSRRARCWTATSPLMHSQPAITRPSCAWSEHTACCTPRVTRTSIRPTAAA